ncbi:MAG: hypothetical protein AB1716_10340 [Planctomycetota bacterium]
MSTAPGVAYERSATAAAVSDQNPGWVGLVRPGVCIPFDSIRSPGAYICNWSGHLLRVPPATLVPNGVMNIVGSEPLYVTKISEDPDVPLTRARQLARGLNLRPAF